MTTSFLTRDGYQKLQDELDFLRTLVFQIRDLLSDFFRPASHQRSDSHHAHRLRTVCNQTRRRGGVRESSARDLQRQRVRLPSG